MRMFCVSIGRLDATSTMGWARRGRAWAWTGWAGPRQSPEPSAGGHAAAHRLLRQRLEPHLGLQAHIMPAKPWVEVKRPAARCMVLLAHKEHQLLQRARLHGVLHERGVSEWTEGGATAECRQHSGTGRCCCQNAAGPATLTLRPAALSTLSLTHVVQVHAQPGGEGRPLLVARLVGHLPHGLRLLIAAAVTVATLPQRSGVVVGLWHTDNGRVVARRWGEG